MDVDSYVCIDHIAFWIQNANGLDKQGICRKWKKIFELKGYYYYYCLNDKLNSKKK